MGIATYRRRDELVLLIDSLRSGLDADAEVEVLVADNEPSATTRRLVNELRTGFPRPLHYVAVETPGIAAARNALVEGARGYDALVFVDDDEVVPIGWIADLLAIAEEMSADVVAGPVRQKFDGPVASWYIEGKCFEFDRARPAVPVPTPYCASNNTLVRVSALQYAPEGFDSRYSNTGGSDSHFFARLARRGAKILLVPAPVVTELVPQGRISLMWLLRRAYRNGTVRARVERDLDGYGAHTVRRAAVSTARIVLGILMTVLAVARRNRGGAARGLQHVAAGAGCIVGLLGFSLVAEYRRTGLSVAGSPWRLFVEFVSSRLGNAALSLLTVVVIAHGLPVETTGTVLAAISYAILLYGFLDLGTGPALVRNSTDGDLNYHITVYFWTRVALTIAVVVVGVGLVPVVFPRAAWSAAFVAMAFVLSSIYAVSGPIGMATKNARPFRFFTLLQSVLVFVGVAATVFYVKEPTASQVVAVYAGAALLNAALSLLWIRRWLVAIEPRGVLRLVARNLREVALLGVATTAGTVYLRIDQMIVLRWVGAAASGYYGLAARVMTQARLVPSAFQMSVMPLLASRVSQGGRLDPREIALFDRTVAAGAVGVSLMVMAPADLAVFIMGGRAFEPAAPLTIILAVSLVPVVFNYLVATTVVMARRDLLYAALVGITLVFNVVVNLLTVPRYGASAAAVTTVISELLAVALLSSLVGRGAGAASPFALMCSTSIAVVAAGAKLLLEDGPIVSNVIGSMVIAAIAVVALAFARRALRELSQVDGYDGVIT